MRDINRHAHSEYLKMIEVKSPFVIWYVFLYSINTDKNKKKYLQHPLYEVPAIRVKYRQSDANILPVWILSCTLKPASTVTFHSHIRFARKVQKYDDAFLKFSSIYFEGNISGILIKVRKYNSYPYFSSKHMLWVLKRTVAMRRFVWTPKTYV